MVTLWNENYKLTASEFRCSGLNLLVQVAHKSASRLNMYSAGLLRILSLDAQSGHLQNEIPERLGKQNYNTQTIWRQKRCMHAGPLGEDSAKWLY